MKVMAEAEQPDIGADGVEIIENMGEWFCARRDQRQGACQHVEVESYARSFADVNAFAED